MPSIHTNNLHACCRMPCRAQVQKQVRYANAKFVVRGLSSLCEEPSVEKINHTGELFPRGSLQRLQVRRLFSFVRDPICHGRFFIARLCKQVVRKLLREGRMCPAVDPSESMDAWVKKQAKRLQYICMRAKRSTCPLDPELEGTGLMGTAMDNMETQAPACNLDALAAAWHACRMVCLYTCMFALKTHVCTIRQASLQVCLRTGLAPVKHMTLHA